MKDLIWLLAGAALYLAGCGENEQAVTRDALDQSVQEDQTAMVSNVVETPAASVDHAANPDMEPADAATSVATEAVESAGNVVDGVSEEVGDSVAAVASTAGAAGAMLEEETPPPADAGTAVVSAIPRGATVDVDLELGGKIYGSKCVTCHGAGVAGAPKLGDATNWEPRIAQGMEVMTSNALNGFQGASGYMPSKGGFSGLTEEEVAAAVAYMAGESR